jgi:hypothetical protein
MVMRHAMIVMAVRIMNRVLDMLDCPARLAEEGQEDQPPAE